VNPDAQSWWNILLMGLMVWREARGESYDAKLAVAYTVITRVANKRWWGDSISAVVTKPYQYSSMTAPRDPQLTIYPQVGDPSFAESVQAAQAAISKGAANPAPEADSYFDDSITPPSWAKPENFCAKIGRLNFYRTI
jgi:N-acetylmuramoyl-L-alanine amidase